MSDATSARPNPLGVHALVWVGGTSPDQVASAIRQTAAAGYDLLELSLHDAVNLDTAAARAELDKMTGRGTPLVEAPWPDAPDDRAVTFLWRDRRGARLGTRTVVLLLNKVTDPSVWDRSVLHHIPGTDVWHRTYRLPSTWQGTYQLAPDDGPTPAAEAAGAAHGPRSRL